MNILVTGANGFIGKFLCDYLSKTNCNVYALVRKPCNSTKSSSQFIVQDILGSCDWNQILNQIDVVIHTAGLAHVKGFAEQDYFKINTEITKRVASECAKFKVKRFIFLSSMAVYGESAYERPIDLSTPLHPKTVYAESKILAEEFLLELHKKGTLDVVIIRPPLVYGAEAKGNIRLLLRAIKFNLPLPFKGINNKRSMIYIENLCDVLRACVISPKAPGKTFLVSDDEDVSIGKLVSYLAEGMKKSSRLFRFPTEILYAIFKLIRRENMLLKVIGSFQIDISHTKRELNWHPNISVHDGLVKTAQSFLQKN